MTLLSVLPSTMTLLLVLLSATFPLVDSVCVSLTSAVKKDTYLQNNTFGVLKKPSLFDCAASCQAHIECLSFGFEPRKRLCHLHNQDGTGAPGDLVPDIQWIHGDLSDLPKDLWGPCADHNCTVGQKCTTNRVTKKAVCVKGDIAKAEAICPVPPQLDNAVLRSGGNKLGSSRTYTCQNGYLDTESFVTSGVTTCLPDFSWSQPNLTCSGRYISKSTHSDDWYSEEPLPEETFLSVVKDSSLVFFCKACSNCIVKLCDSSVGEIQCYQVAIQKNYISIRNDDPIDIPGVLKCTEFRPFWISWRDGIIAVGKGNTVGNQKHTENKPVDFMNINCVILGTVQKESWWLLLRQK